MMKILLADDGSPHSQEAVDEVARRPWPSKSTIRVLSVIQPYTPPATAFVLAGATLEDMRRQQTSEAEHLTARRAARVSPLIARHMSMWSDVLVITVAVIAGGIAAVTGFGIGSLLTPGLAVQVDTRLAVAAVSILHVIRSQPVLSQEEQDDQAARVRQQYDNRIDTHSKD